jgi:hypothetical protein
MKIYYTGNGSKINSLHTKKEFLQIVKNNYPEMIALRIKGIPLNPNLIKKNDINKWMDFTGAIYVIQ